MSFNSITGHKKAIALIQAALRNKTLPHAYIFLGPEGVGKMMTALELAAAVNCETNGIDPCGVCPACSKIKNGNHPDLLVIDGSRDRIKIDTIRDCKRWLSLKPYEGKKKVVLVDRADAMTQESANAFLKTLEEPPVDSLLILTTVNLQSLLPTVISRCNPIKFNCLDNTTIRDILVRKYNLPLPRASVIASLSGGRIGRALSIADNPEVMADRDTAVRLLKNAISGNMENILSESRSLASDRDNLSSILDFISDLLRDITLFSGGEEEALINSDLRETIGKISAFLSMERGIESFELVQAAKRAIKRNANGQLLLENLLIGINNAAGRS